tara:strand:+ start:7822 stop:9075 length:1254 start_codon:yes stop_codon:yes gene_type:complete
MFRINIYLNFYKFLKAIFFFKSKDQLEKSISKLILTQTKKRKLIFASLCRVSFLYILKFFKKENPNKNEIIFSSYNLPEMINVAKNLGFNIKYCDIDYKTGFFDYKKLKKLKSKKTIAIVLTNMFNDFKEAKKIKTFSKKYKINLIEDNAIYFDNFSKVGKKKYYSGSIGDFSIYSFNIMKNISAMYGGALATNNLKFIKFYEKETKDKKSFFKILLLKQISIYLILKTMSIGLLYNLFFKYLIKLSHKNNLKILLKIFYPSLKFRIINFPEYYFTSISRLSLKLIYLQLKDLDERINNFNLRKTKNIYYHNSLKKIKNKNLKLININDFNYQNFIDYPILVKDKQKLNEFLLDNGIEVRYIYYRNCEKIFKTKQFKCKNSNLYEEQLICLPNHQKVNFDYIDKMVSYIQIFLKQNK